jgi:hypothetical protein
VINADKVFGTHNGPQDAQPLPISSQEIEDRKYAWDSEQPSLSYIVSCFAYSLRVHKHDFNSHPSFEDFACGVMASETAPDFVREDKVLRKRYQPHRLRDLVAGDCWSPPNRQAYLSKRRTRQVNRCRKGK